MLTTSSHDSRLVVELGGTGYHDAASGKGITVDPVFPVLEDSPYSGNSPWFIKRWAHHLFGKHLRRPLDYLCLEVFLGVEVGEQPTLGKSGRLGKLAYGHVLQATDAGQTGRFLKYLAFCFFAFGHNIR